MREKTCSNKTQHSRTRIASCQ